MKVFDCFTFFNELDLLEIRFNELNDIVDYFVIIEGEHTWQNNPKPSYYLENIDRFDKFNSKIIRVQVPADKFNSNAWHNEEFSWNSIPLGLHLANQDDLIMISALDEIPSSNSIKQIITDWNGACAIKMNLYYFYLNTRFKFSQSHWSGTYLTKFNELDTNNVYRYILERSKVANKGFGWHFSFLGDAKSAVVKTNSYSHSEYNYITEDIYNSRIESLSDVFGRNEVSFECLDPIDTLPIYVQNNLEKFNKYIRI